MTRHEAARVLGLAVDVDLETLNRQWKRLARKYHPDLHQNDRKKEAKFRLVNEAYGILKSVLAHAEINRVAEEVIDDEFDRWTRELPRELQEKIRRDLERLGKKS